MLPYDPLMQTFCPVRWPSLQMIWSTSNSFFCARYRHGVLLIPLKQQVLFDFPITNIVFFSTRVSCSKASQPNLTIFASTTFLGFQMDTFLWEVLYKINQAQLHCICHRSCNRILWLAKLFPSMEWSHHW